jgi:hypothetical protein
MTAKRRLAGAVLIPGLTALNFCEARMKTFRFHDTLWLPYPRPAIFEFFSDAFNLEKITPPFLKFHVVTAPPI